MATSIGNYVEKLWQPCPPRSTKKSYDVFAGY